MDKEDLRALNRARVTAGWSYLGALIPLIGWILGAISLSNLGSIDEAIAKKDKKRVKAVRKLALGGLILSTLIAILYGSTTAWNIHSNNQAEQQAVQAKASADKASCLQQVEDTNIKIIGFYLKYPVGNDTNTIGGLHHTTDTSACESNAEQTLSKSNSGYKTELNAVRDRCLTASTDRYSQYLETNATSKSKGADGQTLYYMPQTNWDYINKIQQQDKGECNQQYPQT